MRKIVRGKGKEADGTQDFLPASENCRRDTAFTVYAGKTFTVFVLFRRTSNARGIIFIRPRPVMIVSLRSKF